LTSVGLLEREGRSPAEVVRRQHIASAVGDLEALRATLVRVAHHALLRHHPDEVVVGVASPLRQP
jgi:hypothetical protein